MSNLKCQITVYNNENSFGKVSLPLEILTLSFYPKLKSENHFQQLKTVEIANSKLQFSLLKL